MNSFIKGVIANSYFLRAVQMCGTKTLVGAGVIGATIYSTMRYKSIQQELRLHGIYAKNGIFGTTTATMKDNNVTYTWTGRFF